MFKTYTKDEIRPIKVFRLIKAIVPRVRYHSSSTLLHPPLLCHCLCSQLLPRISNILSAVHHWIITHQWHKCKCIAATQRPAHFIWKTLCQCCVITLQMQCSAMKVSQLSHAFIHSFPACFHHITNSGCHFGDTEHASASCPSLTAAFLCLSHLTPLHPVLNPLIRHTGPFWLISWMAVRFSIYFHLPATDHDRHPDSAQPV